MTFARKPWQHDQERISEAQFRVLIAKWGWEVDRFGADYGEDLFVRIFREGNPTGHSFYVQLKGTSDISKYSLKKRPQLSYGISVTNLKQWANWVDPVILCVWDTTEEAGYWLHMQPYIERKLNRSPDWLTDVRKKRHVLIPFENYLKVGYPEKISDTIETAFARIAVAMQFASFLHADTPPSFGQKPNHFVQLAVCEEQIQRNPHNRNAYLKMASIYYELRDMPRALQAINKAFQLDNKSLLAVWGRACILAEFAIANNNQPKSMLHEAIDLFESMRAIADPSITDYNVGNSLAALGRHEEAIELYERALTSPDIPASLRAQIFKNRGTSYFFLGNHEEEFASYRKAIELDPYCWEAYSSWAITEYRRHNYPEAIRFYLKALEANPQLEMDFSVQDSLAVSYWQVQDYESALDRSNKALALKPHSRETSDLKANIIGELWRHDSTYVDEAIEFFEARLIDNPSDFPIYNELYVLLQHHGDPQRARMLLEKAIKFAEAPAQTLYYYALMLEEDGQDELAIDYLNRAFQQCNEHHIAHSLGRLKMKTNSYREAIYYFKIAMRDMVNPSPILDAIAECHYLLENYNAAILYLLRALAYEPTEVHTWDNLFYMLKKKGAEGIYFIPSTLITLSEHGLELTNEEWEKLFTDILLDIWSIFGSEIPKWTENL